MTDSTTPLRKCKTCGVEYPETLEYFHKGKGYRGGLRPYCKSCISAAYYADPEPAKRRAKQSYQRDPQRAYEQSRQRRAENPERWKEYQRTYRLKHKAEIYKKNLKWKRANLEKARFWSARWRENNKERLRNYWTSPRVLEQKREYAKLHPEHRRAIKQRRRARRSGLPDTFRTSDWKFALDYFNSLCAVCGRQIGLWHTLAADHWIPLFSPDCPGTVPDNIVPLCHGADGCNNSKGSTPPATWLRERYGPRRANNILKKIDAYFAAVREREAVNP